MFNILLKIFLFIVIKYTYTIILLKFIVEYDQEKFELLIFFIQICGHVFYYFNSLFATYYKSHGEKLLPVARCIMIYEMLSIDFLNLNLMPEKIFNYLYSSAFVSTWKAGFSNNALNRSSFNKLMESFDFVFFFPSFSSFISFKASSLFTAGNF